MWIGAASVDRAVGAAIVLHAVSFVPVTLLGLVFMTREGLTFGSARALVGAESGRGVSDADAVPAVRLTKDAR